MGSLPLVQSETLVEPPNLDGHGKFQTLRFLFSAAIVVRMLGAYELALLSQLRV